VFKIESRNQRPFKNSGNTLLLRTTLEDLQNKTREWLKERSKNAVLTVSKIKYKRGKDSEEFDPISWDEALDII